MPWFSSIIWTSPYSTKDVLRHDEIGKKVKEKERARVNIQFETPLNSPFVSGAESSVEIRLSPLLCVGLARLLSEQTVH